MKGKVLGDWKMNTIALQELMFADDMVLVAHSTETLQQNIRIYQTELKVITGCANVELLRSNFYSK